MATLPGCVCRKVKDTGLFVLLKVSEMSEMISLKMGVKFANLPQGPSHIYC